MINGMKVLALIPARGGSKGIPKKNIVDLAGKPLISYTIEAAKKSHYIDSVVVSTDSDEIAEVSARYGARIPYMRNTDISGDTSKSIDVIIDAIQRLCDAGEKYDVLVFLQPTSPLRTTEDINLALEQFVEHDCLPLTSVVENDRYPLLIRTIDEDRLIPLLHENSSVRRQDMKKTYYVNGAIYIIKTGEVNITTSLNDGVIPYVMKKRNSCDIDDIDDLKIAKNYLESQ